MKASTSSYVQALTAPLKSIHINDSIEQQAVREAEAEINQAFEKMLDGFRHQVLTVLMRTAQTVLKHRLQVTTGSIAPAVPAVPTMVAMAPAMPSLAAVNGGWRKQRPTKAKQIKQQRRASSDEKAQLQSLLIMIRSAMNWSQAELASRLGVALMTEGNWERGRSYPEPPTYDKIVAIAKETGVLPK